MSFTVFIYDNSVKKSEQVFSTPEEAFSYIGDLDLQTDVKRVLLDNGNNILFDLVRNNDGLLTVNR